jgi:hypothetical protein
MQVRPGTRARFLRPVLAVLAGAVLIGFMGTVARGQWRNRPSASSIDFATPSSFDGSFQFCRVAFRRAGNGDGGGWDVDYPRADQNLSIRLSELTKTPVSFDDRNDPNHLLIRLDQPELFRCPFIMMTEVGSTYLDDREAENLGNYLIKGGFLWADDFWGDYAWAIWESQLRKALPSSAYPIVDLPLEHPIFRQVLNVNHVPQIPSIGGSNWRNGQTAERGGMPDTRTPHVRGLLNQQGRVMALMTHNTDFGDSYEREDQDPDYFNQFSVIGYAFGINALVYGMTH